MKEVSHGKNYQAERKYFLKKQKLVQLASKLYLGNSILFKRPSSVVEYIIMKTRMAIHILLTLRQKMLVSNVLSMTTCVPVSKQKKKKFSGIRIV